MSAQQLKQFRMAIWAGGLLMAILYLVAVSLLGASDYDQAVADHEWTCQMISERVWPADPAIDCSVPSEALASNTYSQ